MKAARRIPAADEVPDWHTGRLSQQLAEIAAGLDEWFVRGGNLLADVAVTIKGLSGVPNGDSRADNADAAAAVAQLRGVAAQVENLPGILRERDDALVEVAHLVRQLESHIDDIQRQLQIIGIYGMNIKIAGAGGDFRIFVDDMGGRLKTGEAEIAVFATRLTGVLQSVVLVRKAYVEVLSTQGNLSADAHRRIAECGARLERQLGGGAAMAGRLPELAGRVQDGVDGALAAITIAASTRQRIEHVVGAIDRVGEEQRRGVIPPGALDHMARLIAGLIEAAGRDHATRSRDLTRSLEQLAAVNGDLAGLVDRRVAGDGAGALRDLDTVIGAIGQMAARLSETATRADVMVACIADAAADLTHRLDSIDQIARDVKEIAINTRLLCLRQGQTGVAVAVIAVEVAAQAIRLKEAAGQIATGIDQLATLNQDLRLAEDTGAGDPGAMLDHARGVIAGACAHGGPALTDGEAVARRLMAQLDQASAILGGDDRLPHLLQPATAALARPPVTLDTDDEAWLCRVLPQIGALYTLAAERQVHAGFLLPGMSAAAAQDD